MKYLFIILLSIPVLSCKKKCEDEIALNYGFRDHCFYSNRVIISEFKLQQIPPTDSLGNPWPQENYYFKFRDHFGDTASVSDTFLNTNIPHVQYFDENEMQLTFSTDPEYCQFHLYGENSGLIKSMELNFFDYLIGGSANPIYPDSIVLEDGGFKFVIKCSWTSSLLQSADHSG